MYEIFYNFKAEPFRLSPDHNFCFEHKSYAKARAYMAYAFKRAEGFVMITGRPGTGKTTLIGELVESLSRDRVCTANLVCTQLQADDLLKTVAFSFGIGSTGVDKAEMLQRLTVLLHRWHREGRRALLIVDEAQDLSTSAMEELRLLTNIQVGGQPLLQIFLVGQPELRDLILSPEMEQVHQRIVAASQIEGLGVEETEAYVMRRLTVVGWNGDPAIDRAIFPPIHKFSEGVPRRINLICSRLFLLGSVEQRHDIRVEDVRVVITELQAENLAAGTGVSPQDFEQVNEPDWVPVPQSSTAHRLHAVENIQEASVGVTPSESPTGAKKKESPDLVLQSPPSPNSHPAGVDGATEYFAVESEYDQESGAEFSSVPVEQGLGHYSVVTEKRAVPHAAAATAAPTRLRRFITLACVVLAVLSLVLLTVYLSNRKAASSIARESSPRTGVGSVINPSSEAAKKIAHHQQFSERLANAETDSTSILEQSTAEPSAVSTAPRLRVEESLLAGSTVRPDVDAKSLAESTMPGSESELVTTNISISQSPDASRASVSESGTAFPSSFSVNFLFDSDALIPASHRALDQAVAIMRENPGSVASITGFTDKQGDEEYNLVLSRKRADAVKQYLVKAGIEQGRLRVEGRGAQMELDPEYNPDAEDPMEPYRVVQIKLSGKDSY
jgi:general secretion pathway protein A